MFVQISPNENDLSETICSLNFASRVRGIELGPAKRQLDPTELLKYKQLVWLLRTFVLIIVFLCFIFYISTNFSLFCQAEKTKQEMKIKDLQIKKMEETIQGLDSKMKERDIKTKGLQDKVSYLNP